MITSRARKAYFGISKSNRPYFDQEIFHVRTCLGQYNIQLLVFVDEYEFAPNQEKAMMEAAFREIDTADFMIAEVSKKAIGVGVEVGYAFAKRKPIIYIKKREASYSTTVGGCAEACVVYDHAGQLVEQIETIINDLVI